MCVDRAWPGETLRDVGRKIIGARSRSEGFYERRKSSVAGSMSRGVNSMWETNLFPQLSYSLIRKWF